jgi:hypothetical protein
MNFTDYMPFLYDGHGHSKASDGLHSPEKIIDKAVQKGLNIIGLSDHNVVDSLPRFLNHADKINKHETIILPIASVEMSTLYGDMLVAIPDRDHAENFISKYKKPSRRPEPLEIIEEYITKYNAIIILLHPETPYVNCFKLEYIEKMLAKLPSHYHKNLGIEVYNWMMQAFFWHRKKRENTIHKKNHSFKLAPFSFTDYHSANNVGNGSTTVFMHKLDSASFIEAVQNRRTAPHTTNKRNFSESIETIRMSLVAEGLSRFTNRDFHIPKH